MKGFGGFPGNIQGLVKQAQKVQDDIRKVTEAIEEMSFEGSSGGGMVKVVMSGKYRIIELFISPDVVKDGDVDLLQDMIKAAINEAVTMLDEKKRTELEKVTGGISIPGLM